MKASEIGFEKDIYCLLGLNNGLNPNAVDDAWNQYEKKLGTALDELSRKEQSSISAQTWLNTLVPFVSALFVRGIDFKDRYETRPVVAEIYADTGFSSPEWISDNTNLARLIELQRLRAPVMAARWIVLHAKSNHPIITNELGFTFFQPPEGGNFGIAIPIGKRTILVLTRTWPVKQKVIIHDKSGQWRTPIEHFDLEPENEKGFNQGIANIASHFIAGSTKESIESCKENMQNGQLDVEMIGSFFPYPSALVRHESDWLNAVTAIGQKPNKAAGTEIAISMEAV